MPERAVARAGRAARCGARLVGLLAGLPLVVAAQFSAPDPEWKEAEAPPPPALRTDRLVPIELPGSALHFGVDPASISIGPDRVVRYVVVARSTTGAVNALYEGVQCNSATVKVYARHNPDSGWSRPAEAVWQPLHGNSAQRHSLVIARTGVCLGNAPNGSPATIARDLASPVDSRFSNEVRR